MNSNDTPLPYGWIKETDKTSGHVYYVDTKANPPRSIWTHPYQDEQYLNEHPDVRANVRGSNIFGSDTSLPLPPPELPRRHSYSGRESTPVPVPPPAHKKSFLEKLKDKAVHSMEEHNERKRQQMLAMQEQQERYFGQGTSGIGGASHYGAPQYAYPPSLMMGMRSNRYRGGMGGMGMGGMGMGGGMGGMGRMGGMGGMALPLMGGLGGGMLLGNAMGGGFGGGDGCGGGGFGGGDCGGF